MSIQRPDYELSLLQAIRWLALLLGVVLVIVIIASI